MAVLGFDVKNRKVKTKIQHKHVWWRHMDEDRSSDLRDTLFVFGSEEQADPVSCMFVELISHLWRSGWISAPTSGGDCGWHLEY